MSSIFDKKKAIREYKERKTPRGVFAMRCKTTGQVWVGGTLDLRAAQNSLFFALRAKASHNKTLQSEWDTHGEAAFVFEIIETLDDDVLPMALRELLREKTGLWANQLAARTLLP